MDTKYFTEKSNLKILYGITIPILIVVLFLLMKYSQLLWLVIGYTAFIVIITITSFYFPIVDEKVLIIKNSIFRFKSAEYGLDKIETIQICFGGYGNLGLSIKLKNKRYKRFIPICSMGYKSIKPFVDDIRSKGIKVECRPYRHNSKTIYL